MRILKTFQLPLALVVMLAPDTLQAQEQTVLDKNWIVLNSGIIFPDKYDLDLYWGINYNFGNKLVYQIGFRHFTDFWQPSIRTGHLNVSRGIAALGRYHNVAAFGGLVIGLGKRRADYFYEDLELVWYGVVGLQANIQINVMILRSLGMGIELHGNVNSAGQRFIGLGLALQIGGKRSPS